MDETPKPKRAIPLAELAANIARRRREIGMDDPLAASAEGWEGQRINHDTFAASLAERRAKAKVSDVPRNDGARRTKSKRALLKAIKDVGWNW